MLVLGRRPNQTVKIGDNIVITICKVHGRQVSLGIQAPPEVPVVRGELEGQGLPRRDRPSPQDLTN